LREILVIAACLLTPVAALLFLTRRKLIPLHYPHFLLERGARRGFSGFFSRFAKTWYDSLFDTALAICLALVLAASGFLSPRPGSPGYSLPGRKALVVDLSLSMLDGAFGKRALDRAIALVSDKARSGDFRVFGLVFDPEKRRTILAPLEKFLGGDKSETTAVMIADSFDFFSLDYDRLKELPAQGFDSVTLFTDDFPLKASGFEVVELGKGDDGGSPSAASWPVYARYDRMRELMIVEMVDSGSAPALSFSKERGGIFVPPEPGLVRVQALPGGSRIEFREPGLYLIRVMDGTGGEFEYPMLYEAARRGISVSGEFSRAMASCFPLLEESASGRLFMYDLPATGIVKKKPGIASALLESDCPFILDPAETSASLVAAGYSPEADFALGSASIHSPELVFAYDSAILGSFTPYYVTSLPESCSSLSPSGSAWMARTGSGAVPLLPGSSEFFPDLPHGRLVLPPSTPRKTIWLLLFALLAAGKLLVAAILRVPAPVPIRQRQTSWLRPRSPEKARTGSPDAGV
jgi:hypothetical protein